MMMKKFNLWLFLSLFVAAFTLTACGDDDDEPADTNALSGTWQWVEQMGNEGQSVNTFVFGSSNSFKWTDEKLFNGQLHVRWIYTGTYTVLDGNNFSVIIDKTLCQNPDDPEPWDAGGGDSFTATYRISGNKLYITRYEGIEEGPYTKQ